MGKNSDLAILLSIVVIGMFIPFIGSVAITFNMDITQINSWYKIASTFGWFLLIFAVELAIVLLYFTLTSRIANKKLKDLENK